MTKQDIKPIEEDSGFALGEKLDMVNETVPMLKSHSWRQKGPYAYCTICPMEHGLYLDNSQEVREGKIVKKLRQG